MEANAAPKKQRCFARQEIIQKEMSAESPNFFSDPKVVLSLLALFISGISLVWTLANQFEQNRRWDSINAASIELSRPCLQVFREITKKEYQSIDWGYVTTLYGAADSIDRLQMVNCLRARERNSEQLILGIDPASTVEELNGEIARKGYKRDFELVKDYRPIFYLRNNGKTDAENWSASVDVYSVDGRWVAVAPVSKPMVIHPNQEVNITFDIIIPIETSIPERLPFRIKMSFEDVNRKRHQSEIKITWTAPLNYWVYE